MAIPFPLAEFICSEHCYCPLPKHILLLGRQTMPFGPEELIALAKKFNLPLKQDTIKLDYTTIYAKQNPDKVFVTDTSFFEMLGVEKIDAIDVSDFEGANILMDLTKSVPDNLYGQFDFIFNGSVLDNIWDPPELIRNTSRLLSAKGRILHVETATAMAYSYSALSPSWYFDYYVMNNWEDCRIYLATVPDLDKLGTVLKLFFCGIFSCEREGIPWTHAYFR